METDKGTHKNAGATGQSTLSQKGRPTASPATDSFFSVSQRFFDPSQLKTDPQPALCTTQAS
jgi:hypothetical protein